MSDDWKDGTEEQEFEAALARSLRRVEPPHDFAARVMARAEAERPAGQTTPGRERPEGRLLRWLRSFQGAPGWKPVWGALAAVLVAAVLMGHVVRERHAEQQARMQASREFDVSVQITDRVLDHTREQLRRAGVPLDADGQ